MQVSLSRKVQPAPFEMGGYDVTVTDEDMPRREGEALHEHMLRMELFALRRVLAFEMFHHVIDRETAMHRLAEFRSLMTEPAHGGGSGAHSEGPTRLPARN